MDKSKVVKESIGNMENKVTLEISDTVLLKSFVEANELFASRNAEYGNAFEKHGAVIESFFPDGVALKTEDDFKRFGLVNAIINKMVRYCRNFEHGHPDSIADAAVYCHMLGYVDDKENKNGR